MGSWNEQAGLGEVFSSSTIFKLPGGGSRSPDAAWVEQSRWDALSETEQEEFPSICPAFVIELRSWSDRLKPLQDKMQEYLDSGLQLGLLINPKDEQVERYLPGQPVEILQKPMELKVGKLLPGFVLKLASIWK